MQEDKFFDPAEIETIKQKEGAIQHALIHALGGIGLLLTAFVHPLIYILSIGAIWGVSRALEKQAPSIRDHARTALNFHITILLWILLALGLVLAAYALAGQLITVFFLPTALFMLLGICLSFYRAGMTYLGEKATEYPFAYPFFKRPKNVNEMAE